MIVDIYRQQFYGIPVWRKTKLGSYLLPSIYQTIKANKVTSGLYRFRQSRNTDISDLKGPTASNWGLSWVHFLGDFVLPFILISQRQDRQGSLQGVAEYLDTKGIKGIMQTIAK